MREKAPASHCCRPDTMRQAMLWIWPAGWPPSFPPSHCNGSRQQTLLAMRKKGSLSVPVAVALQTNPNSLPEQHVLTGAREHPSRHPEDTSAASSSLRPQPQPHLLPPVGAGDKPATTASGCQPPCQAAGSQMKSLQSSPSTALSLFLSLSFPHYHFKLL